MFDDKRRKRTVTVRVMRFTGVGRHYHVSMTQENNPIWDLRDDPPFFKGPCWRLARDDQEGNGLYISEKFRTWERAMAFIEKTCAKKFPGHRVVKDYEEPTHIYKREGD